jgi:putative spermidine/putrescine transport system ATP-binding protein
VGYLELKNINKQFNQKSVLENVCISVEKGDFVSLLGKSGCGKTTLLRIIAGLDMANSGTILLDGNNLSALPAQSRNIGFVFQNYALFPHMDVSQNVAYGLKIKKIESRLIEKKVTEVLEKVSLVGKAKTNVMQLSGGEQQRVALARAIVMEPQIILLDEPLSNLDYTLRLQARNELKRLQRDLGITTIYVTHDQSEALALSDKIHVMNNGVIQQSGSPQEIYYHPQNYFTASFVGRYNLFDTQQAASYFNQEIERGFSLAILPEDLNVQKSTQTSGLFVKEILFTGAISECILSDNNNMYKATLTTGKQFDLKIGDAVSLSFQIERIKIIS